MALAAAILLTTLAGVVGSLSVVRDDAGVAIPQCDVEAARAPGDAGEVHLTSSPAGDDHDSRGESIRLRIEALRRAVDARRAEDARSAFREILAERRAQPKRARQEERVDVADGTVAMCWYVISGMLGEMTSEDLFRVFASQNASSRRSAMWLLDTIDDGAMFSNRTLGEFLRTGKFAERLGALEVTSMWPAGRGELLSLVTNCVDSGENSVRLQALVAMARLGAPGEEIERLIRQGLASEDAGRVLASLTALSRVVAGGVSMHVEECWALLGDSRYAFRTDDEDKLVGGTIGEWAVDAILSVGSEVAGAGAYDLLPQSAWSGSQRTSQVAAVRAAVRRDVGSVRLALESDGGLGQQADLALFRWYQGVHGIGRQEGAMILDLASRSPVRGPYLQDLPAGVRAEVERLANEKLEARVAGGVNRSILQEILEELDGGE